MERYVLTSSLPTTAVALLLVASGLLAANAFSTAAPDSDELRDEQTGKPRSRHRISRRRRMLA